MTPVTRLAEGLLGSASVGISALGGFLLVSLRLAEADIGRALFGEMGR